MSNLMNDALLATMFAFVVAIAAICVTVIAMFIYSDRKAIRAHDEGQDDARKCGFTLGRIAAASEIRREVQDLWSTTEIPGGPEDSYNTCIETMARIDAYIYRISWTQEEQKETK